MCAESSEVEKDVECGDLSKLETLEGKASDFRDTNLKLKTFTTFLFVFQDLVLNGVPEKGK